ncbi:MAG: right-handed parallel beta-helix repeat-containing protein [Vulcanimicrobiota bacterium]
MDNTAADGGSGTQSSPFDTLAEAVAEAQSADTIFVARRDGTSKGMTGGFNLPAGVKLIGEGSGLILAQTVVPVGQAPTIEGPINCGGDNLIQGLTIDGSTDDLIRIDGVGDVTINENALSNPTQRHIAIVEGSGTLTITGNRFDKPSDYPCIGMENIYVDATVHANGNTFSNDSEQPPDLLCYLGIGGTSALDFSFNDNVAKGSQAVPFHLGLGINNSSSGPGKVTVTGNEFSYFDEAISIDTFFDGSGTTSGAIADNTISDVQDGIIFEGRTDTLTISGNTIANVDSGGSGIRVDLYGPEGGTVVIENNNFSNGGRAAVGIGHLDDTNAKLALRNNSFSGSGQYDALILGGNEGTYCFDITGNIFNQDLFLESEGDSGVFTVERFDQGLTNFNTFNPPSEVLTEGEITDGTCNIP